MTANLWDFGGQDIYHGTHALFLRTKAIFVIVWSADSESGEQEFNGLRFKNFPVEYWLAYVRQLAGADCPVILMQNKCDTSACDLTPSFGKRDEASDFKFFKSLHYSALNNRNRIELDTAVSDAIRFLLNEDMSVLVGKGRAEVRDMLDWMRSKDVDNKYPSLRKNRVITAGQFDFICDVAGGVSSPELLLEYLHNCGTVFYQSELFQEKIIIDQSWALEAIYCLFERERVFGPIKGCHGRFTMSLLGLLAWEDYTAETQALFITMMESCGMCFKVRSASGDARIEAEYLAPDLLPPKSKLAGQIAAFFDSSGEHDTVIFKYSFLHVALLRRLMSRLAGRSAVFWKYGFYDGHGMNGDQVLVDHAFDDDSIGGTVTIRCKGSRRDKRLTSIVDLVEQENLMFPSCAIEMTKSTSQVGSPTKTERPAEVEEWFLSQCLILNGGSTSDGAISDFLKRIKLQGTRVVQATSDLPLGALAKQFINSNSRNKKIIILICDQYLRSERCMMELFWIYYSLQFSNLPLDCVKVFADLGTDIGNSECVSDCVAYWSEKRKVLAEALQEIDDSRIRDLEWENLKGMLDIENCVENMLVLLNRVMDIHQIKDLENFVFEQP